MKRVLKISIALCVSTLLMFITGAKLQSQTTTVANVPTPSAPQAPTGYDNQTNGMISQAVFDEDLATFAEVEDAGDGLGPVFNAKSCAECHANPVVGGGSQVMEFRAGKMVSGQFKDHPGGSLIQDRALDPSIQERVDDDYDVRTLRLSPPVLGAGFVEAIPDSTLQAISNNQPFGMRGMVVKVPVLEAPGTTRIGRFGWKDQHGSLVSFSADAYLNEMGITSFLQPTENTSNGNSVAKYDQVPDPEDTHNDVAIFAEFMRATKAPPRDAALAATASAQSGARIFDRIGCDTCHVQSIVTAPMGTVINGGTFTVPAALGSQTIHPYGDFLLHDIGTGDGIVQNGGAQSRNKVRTAPLWGLRTRTHLMHDGASVTISDAIQRHRNEAMIPAGLFRFLSPGDQDDLLTFLNSL
jgi:CxxC motif-containing protein (DUF1111 family)